MRMELKELERAREEIRARVVVIVRKARETKLK